MTGTVRGSTRIGFPTGAMAVAFRTVWAAVANNVERINPSTDELLRTVHLEDAEGIVGASEIGVGKDVMWAATDRTLYRIDPFTGRVIGSTEITGSTGMTVADGIVWIVDDFSGTLTAFGESTGEVRDVVELAGSLDGVAVGGGSVWVLDREAGVVTVVDPESLSVVDIVRVGGDERDMTFGAEALWLADGEDRSVTRVDPVTRQVATLEIPGQVPYVTVDVDTGDVWALSVPKA